jgi:hypothetical protein
MKKHLIAITGALIAASPAWSQQSPTGLTQQQRLQMNAAQGASLKRMQTALNTYADSFKLDRMFITYCQGELELHTYNYPSNGNIMFSFNYNTTTSLDMANAAIVFREQYEESYVMICLAGIKKTLDAARAAN